MEASERQPAAQPRADEESRAPAAARADLQPADSGAPGSGPANRGSPAAPVMKQFAKTGAEGNGSPEAPKKTTP